MGAGCCAPGPMAKAGLADFIGNERPAARFGNKLARAFQEATDDLLARWEAMDPQTREEVYRAIRDLPLDASFREFKVTWEKSVEEVLTEAGEKELQVIGEWIQASSGEELLRPSFNIQNPYSRVWMRERSGSMITNITEGTRSSLQKILDQSIRDGVGSKAIAKRIGDSVGLTPRMAAAVRTRRAKLEAEGRDPAQVERMTEKYRQKLLRRRGENIARTEIREAQNQGTLDAWKVGQDEGFVPGDVSMEWIAGFGSGRTCINCASMHGVIVPVHGKFDTPLGQRARPPLHPSCRCTIGMVIPGEGYQPAVRIPGSGGVDDAKAKTKAGKAPRRARKPRSPSPPPLDVPIVQEGGIFRHPDAPTGPVVAYAIPQPED